MSAMKREAWQEVGFYAGGIGAGLAALFLFLNFDYDFVILIALMGATFGALLGAVIVLTRISLSRKERGS